jgi:hypothetical protein
MEILAVIVAFALVGIMRLVSDRGPDVFADEVPSTPAPSRLMGWCATGYFAQLEKEGRLDGKSRKRPEENGNSQ